MDSYSPRVQRLFLKFLLFHEECHRRQRAEQKRTGQKLDVVAKEAQAWFETAKEALRFGIRIVFSEDGPKLVEFETAEDVFSRISQRATVNNEIEELQRQEFFPNFMEITNWVRQNYFN